MSELTSETIKKPRILAGPYGTRLDKLGHEIGVPSLSNPRNILQRDMARRYTEALHGIVRDDVHAGATALATNTWRLGKRDNREQFTELVGAHTDALNGSIRSIFAHYNPPQGAYRTVEELLACGPAADDGSPKLAPNFNEAFEIHMEQLRAARPLSLRPHFETIGTIDEARGIAAAARAAERRCSISFKLDMYGKLISGEALSDAIVAVDPKADIVICFGLNCCPIEGVEAALRDVKPAIGQRIGMVYPNASSFPDNHLNGGAENGKIHGIVDRPGFAAYLNGLAQRPNLNVRVIGGCCGCDHHDIAEMSRCVQGGVTQEHLPETDYSRYLKGL